MAKHERGLRFQPTGGSRAPQIPVGKKQRLTIERLANDGRGIAFFEGRTWFVMARWPVKTSKRGCWAPTAKWSRPAPSGCSRPANCAVRRRVRTLAAAAAAACSTCPMTNNLP
jgi:hypothetical protein